MKLEIKVLLITLLFGIPAFFLGPVIWPVSHNFGLLTYSLQPSFKFLYMLESLLFGLGVSFLLLGWPLVRKSTSLGNALTVYLSVAWLLLSWWPHDNFHLAAGPSIKDLIYLEYIFHIPTMVATLIVIKGFLEALHGVYSVANPKD